MTEENKIIEILLPLWVLEEIGKTARLHKTTSANLIREYLVSKICEELLSRRKKSDG